ncbi:hypothetical protein E2562_001106 [Oryza meyeriana var. granulata]|uniref:Uncharacterized protein n=1 Tax=Oryza meyeriana var. granulata TaxID=110450 RepID=A0A6G1EE56_9ORYZ|nr:hypothetical protein E2562_001106 [Oryza meyeriana var. granulata]
MGYVLANVRRGNHSTEYQLRKIVSNCRISTPAVDIHQPVPPRPLVSGYVGGYHRRIDNMFSPYVSSCSREIC